LPVPQEPAYADKRSQGWRSAVGIRASRGLEGRGERPAMGYRQPRAGLGAFVTCRGPGHSLTYVSRNRARLWKSLPRSTYRTTVTSVLGSTSSSKGT